MVSYLRQPPRERNGRELTRTLNRLDLSFEKPRKNTSISFKRYRPT
jgi:hypothetical protein